MPVSRNRQRGYLLVACAAALFSVNAGVARVIQTVGVDSATLTTVRCTGTAIVLVGVVAARGERLRLPGSWAGLLGVVGFAISGVALVQWFYFVAIDRLPVGVALLLQFTAPVPVTLFVRFGYREHVRSRIWLGIALSLGGLALVAEVWAGLSLDGLGVLAGLGAALSLAVYFLIGERSVVEGSPIVVLTEAFIVASVFWNVVAPINGLLDLSLDRPRSLGGSLESWHAPLWLLLTTMIVLGTAVPFVAELSALRHLNATEVTLVAMLEPVGATILGWSWFNETLTGVQIIGVAAILLGIGLAQTARATRRVRSTATPIL